VFIIYKEKSSLLALPSLLLFLSIIEFLVSCFLSPPLLEAVDELGTADDLALLSREVLECPSYRGLEPEYFCFSTLHIS
jgi:hypothetical protein